MKRQSIAKPKATKSTLGRPGPVVTLKKILVPTDFSDPSGKALEYGAALAAQFGAAVTLLHIAEVGSMGYEHGVDAFPPPWRLGNCRFLDQLNRFDSRQSPLSQIRTAPPQHLVHRMTCVSLASLDALLTWRLAQILVQFCGSVRFTKQPGWRNWQTRQT